ncbi:hypothetical protein HK096_010408 [Nowakowskiella sp. JEL0078]|nr:hypothetical protein HK096_010408 [Nowakowskiella sp. JEL0078]
MANTVRCPICFEDLVPNHTVTLACSHFFCSSCLSKAAQSSISIYKIPVPCPLCTSTIPEHILSKLLKLEDMERYHSASFNLAAVTLDVVRCPGVDCGFFAEPAEGGGFFECSACGVRWCEGCRALKWHVGLSCTQYAAIEPQVRRRGSWNWIGNIVKTQVKSWESDRLFERTIRDDGASARCPNKKCRIPIEKGERF